MAFTTNYYKFVFGQGSRILYISAALKEAKSLEYLTMIENVKYKSNIQKQACSMAVLADATCDFTAAGTLTMTENVLRTKIVTNKYGHYASRKIF
jgi:hypothetical protein